MSEVYATLEEATAALASTAERAAILIRTESARAKEEALRTRREIDDLRSEVRAAKTEFEGIRSTLTRQDDERERVRRSAGWAWSAVGVMAACMMFAIGWTATQLTRGQTLMSGLKAELADAKNEIARRDAQLASVKLELESARLAQVRAEVELQVMLDAPLSPEKTPDPATGVEKPVNVPDKPADPPVSIIDVDPLLPR